MGDKNTEFDVIIVGGGPSGLSALLWCSDLGLRAILLEKEPEFGGQLLYTHNAIQNYLGVVAANGRELRDIFLHQVSNTALQRVTGAEIMEADLLHKTVKLADNRTYSSRAIIIATGVRRRKLGIEGEEQFFGRGILESGVKGKEWVSGKNVLIVGGGDAAIENALILSQSAARVFVVHRRDDLTARRSFIDGAQKSDTIKFIASTKITAIVGDVNVRAVEMQHLISGEISRLQIDAVLVRIGVAPNTKIFRGQIELDEAGYVVIDANCRTNLRGVFAAGDVANPVALTLGVAVGNGAAAAKAVFREMNSR